MKVSAFTFIKNGQILRLKNKGFKDANRYKTGDQYIKISIDIPQNISKDLKNKILDLIPSSFSTSTSTHNP